jgi:uroporphyrin-III C-methyltransferase
MTPQASSLLTQAVPPGIVYLVGVGPGDPRMLTLRAFNIIEQADVIFHGRLVNAEILELAGSARRVYTGRRDDGSVSSTDDILNDIARHVERGDIVVHLKNGDPLLFSATAEEIEGLRARGLAFELVPGVCSALAAPAAAQLPITYDGLTRSVALVDGHEFGRRDATAWRALKADTVIVLMGWDRLGEICQQMRDMGWRDDTPAAVISQVGRPDTNSVIGTLMDVAERAQTGLRPPAVLLVGDALGRQAVPR